MTFFTGDCNARSQLWYLDCGTTPEGEEISNLISSLGLYQTIKEQQSNRDRSTKSDF